jgi:ABC-type amino acid transport substrate-binding protein
MDLFSFISEIIKALAWPVVVVIVVLLLRIPLSNSVPLLKRLKALDVELEFSTQLAEVQAKVSDISHIDITVNQNQSQLSVTSVEMPSVEIILEAWLELRNSIISAAKNSGLSDDDGTVSASLKCLKTEKRLDESLLKVIRDLEDMKNKALGSQGSTITIDEARAYAGHAQAVVRYLDSSSISDPSVPLS